VKKSSSARGKRIEAPASRYRVQVLDRTIAVLQAVADSETDLPAADIARQLRLHKSTVHRLLVVLESYRLIKKGPEGAYGLGTRLIELGECAIARLKLSEYAEPHLRRLADQTGEGAHVTILNGTELLSIAHVEGRWALHSLTRTGQSTQIHCTAAGKAVLAFLSDDACDELLARLPLKRNTRRTIVKSSAIRLELMRARELGYAVDDEEFEEGLRCVSAPIFDHRDHVVASLSMAAPVFRLRKERVPQVARLVVAAANALSDDLGWQNPSETKPGTPMRVAHWGSRRPAAPQRVAARVKGRRFTS
jgi:DNA-binding IclR family transcriptional regulator